MNPVLKIIAGVLLVLSSFIFLVWKFFAWPDLSFGQSLLLNILAFFSLGAGLFLSGARSFSFNKKTGAFIRPEEKEKPKEEEKFGEIKNSDLKEFGKDEHERFMPE